MNNEDNSNDCALALFFGFMMALVVVLFYVIESRAGGLISGGLS